MPRKQRRLLDKMKTPSKAKIIDITHNRAYQKYLYKCLAPAPFRKYKKRHVYLTKALSKGFCKKLLAHDGNIVGQIEYAPAEVSGFPINGRNIIIMHCIWVLRKAKGHNFGRLLLNDMIKNENKINGFATVALEDHWSPWMKKDHMEKLGFKTIDSFKVRHKTKHRDQCFTIHLMWLPTTKDAEQPTWNKTKLLRGLDFCKDHPLYHPENLKLTEIFEEC
ncbi:MAG: hypothetical protein QXM22_05110 [Candidatus Bathyarchaeia archaeon]